MKGAGATFPEPAYQQWAELFKEENKRAEISYEGIGSGAGVQKLKEGAVDFAGTEKPLTSEELAGFTTRPIQIPTLVSGIVPVYNVPGVKQDIKFTGPVLARIYLGIIREWNDPDLVDINPGVNLPPLRISVLHREEESGTTYVWTSYLSKVSDAWKDRVGAGLTVKWPVGQGVKGNVGMSDAVKATANSIGYIDLPHALRQKLVHGPVKNAAGKFVRASLPAITRAADSVKDIPNDFEISLLDLPGDDVFPITTFTWMLIPSKMPDAQKRGQMKDFLRYILQQGQFKALDLEYGTLPQRMAQKALEAGLKITE